MTIRNQNRIRRTSYFSCVVLSAIVAAFSIQLGAGALISTNPSLIFSSVAAQQGKADKVKIDAKAGKPDAEGKDAKAPSLALTDAEIKEKEGLIKELAPVQQKASSQQQAAMQKMMTLAEDDEDGLMFNLLKFRRASLQIEDVNRKYGEWIAKMQAAHGCPWCQLEGSTFVKAEAEKGKR